MPISVKCPHCGKRLKAPDSAAGKKAKCPGCGQSVKLPEEKIYEAEEVVEEAFEEVTDDEYGLSNIKESDAYGGPAEDDRRPCPACGEMIIATAAKCRYCGEVFDETLKRRERKKKKQRESSEDDTPTASDWVICCLCPGIGCIGSVIYLIQGKRKGLMLLGVSICMAIVYNILFAILGALGNGR